VFTVAKKLLNRRVAALVALVVTAVAFGNCGHGPGSGGNPHNPVGLWEGPL
jgi:hypothetical protein